MRSGYAPPLAGTPNAVVEAEGGREVTSVSTTREIGGGGVPGQTATAAASGSVTWAGETVQSGPSSSPWNRVAAFPPVPGSSVQANVGTVETGAFPMLTGVIDDSSAGADGIVTSSIVDSVDRLHRKITLPPLLASMPPAAYGDPPRQVGLMSDHIVDTVLRRCAYFSTPYQPAAVSGVSVPGQGSMWPDRGDCITAGDRYETGYAADFLSAEWGWGILDANATYTPDGPFTLAGGAEISCMVSAQHSASADITVSVAGSAHTFSLLVGGNRAVSARYYNGSTTATVASVPGGEGWRRVTMRISAGSVWLGTSDGHVDTGTHTAPASVTTEPVSQVRIRVIRGGRIGGVIVGNMPTGYYLDQPLNARLWAGTSLNPKLHASPRIERRDALEVLDEIAAATCRSYWWDEDGTLTWMPGDYMLSRSPGLTLTSQDSLVDLGWSEALADTYAQVDVDHQMPVISRSRVPNVMVWQGAGDSMAGSEHVEEIATPASGEEWILPDSAPRLAWGTFLNDINHGRWSVMGGVRTDGTDTWWAREELSTEIEPIGPFAWKFTYETSALSPEESVQRAMPNDDQNSSLWQRWRNEKLPIMRAYGKVEWAAESVTSGSGNGAAGVYQHDGKQWVQGYTEETPKRIADFLAEWLCKPRVMAKSVSIIPDPRIQVGDVHRIRDEHAHGIELTVMVTRVEQSTSAAEQTMTLDFFVIDGAPAWVTLGEHDGQQLSTFSIHNTSQAGESLSDHGTDPLHAG